MRLHNVFCTTLINNDNFPANEIDRVDTFIYNISTNGDFIKE